MGAGTGPPSSNPDALLLGAAGPLVQLNRQEKGVLLRLPPGASAETL